MEIKKFINQWLTAANAFNTEKFVALWHKNASLHDPSVGKTFKGHKGITTYFEDYFVGYHTQTQLVKIDITSDHEVHLEVVFTGTFPGHKIGGMFDLTLKEGKIIKATAGLI